MSLFNAPDLRLVLGRVGRLLAVGTISIKVARRYGLEEVAESQRAVLEESFLGKLIVPEIGGER